MAVKFPSGVSLRLPLGLGRDESGPEVSLVRIPAPAALANLP